MSRELRRRQVLQGGGAVTVLALAGCAQRSERAPERRIDALAVTNAHLYSGPGCSCCHEYAAYLKSSLDVPLATSETTEYVDRKRQHGIPRELWSCHTVELDDYAVEGHVPVEAIAALLEDAPAIDGIALPGMPAGSPGMGGEKRGPFTVYAVGGGRTGDVYVEL